MFALRQFCLYQHYEEVCVMITGAGALDKCNTPTSLTASAKKQQTNSADTDELCCVYLLVDYEAIRWQVTQEKKKKQDLACRKTVRRNDLDQYFSQKILLTQCQFTECLLLSAVTDLKMPGETATCDFHVSMVIVCLLFWNNSVGNHC